MRVFPGSTREKIAEATSIWFLPKNATYFLAEGELMLARDSNLKRMSPRKSETGEHSSMEMPDFYEVFRDLLGLEENHQARRKNTRDTDQSSPVMETDFAWMDSQVGLPSDYPCEMLMYSAPGHSAKSMNDT